VLRDTAGQIVLRGLLQISTAVAVVRGFPVIGKAIRLRVATYGRSEHVAGAETGIEKTGLRAGLLEGESCEGENVLRYGADLGVREL
jgi:hypothetical protein